MSFLDDPPRALVKHTVISVDDHLVEPPHMFEGRLPGRFADQAPRVLEVPSANGGPPSQAWEYEGRRYSQVGLNAVAGRDKSDYVALSKEPSRFDEIRPGCYDIDARVHDMDLDGVWASVSFPSQISGFCGAVFAQSDDAELGLAVVRAWNDWFHEEWWSPYPERIVPMGITWLAAPALAAEEIRRNAARGFVAVTLPEMPHRLGYPSLHSGWWDPVLAACVETDTTVCLHVGSSGHIEYAEDGPRMELRSTLFPALSLMAAVDWLWSGVAVRFPELRVVFAEGGIGWVPMLLDRLEYMTGHSGAAGTSWTSDLSPADVLRRNFYFCMLDDPSTLVCRDRIGIDHIMVEVDYPHSDSTWPDTQGLLERRLAGLPIEDVRKMTHENAARVFRHPLPESTRP